MSRAYGWAPLALLLTACEPPSLHVDLSVNPVDNVLEVVVPIAAVSLLDASGSSHRLTPNGGLASDLLALAHQGTVGLVSGAELKEGRYTGLALELSATGAYVRGADGRKVSVILPAAKVYADLDVVLEEDHSQWLVAVLDLRFSLSDQSASLGAYSLQPHLKVRSAGTAAAIAGTIAVSRVEECRQGRPAGRGVAVYAYAAQGIAPGDYVSGYAGPSIPVASAPLRWHAAQNRFTYRFGYLAAGDYSLAVTCEADQEDPLRYQDLRFGQPQEAELTAGREVQLDLD